MADQTFTPEQVAEQIAAERSKWETEILKPVQDQVTELIQYKPIDKTDAEIALEQREQEIWQKEIELELKANNLEDFAPFIHASNADELKESISNLSDLLKAKKLDANNFVPESHKKQSAYDVASKSGNVTSMIDAKLAGLFK